MFAGFYCRLSDEDLAALHSGEYPPHGGVGPRVTLYLGAEVECLSRRKHLEERRRQSATRKEQLEEILNVQLDDVDPVLFYFATDHSAIEGIRCETYFADVRKRLGVLDRAKAILDACPLAHPGAAITFCIDNLEGGPCEFQQQKERIQNVLRVAGSRIMQFLSKRDRRQLLFTPLKEAVEQFELQDKQHLIREWLLKQQPAEVVDEIMEHPACQLRIERAYDCPTAARKLVEFWETRSDTELRRTQIELAFAQAQVQPDVNLPQYQDYVQGRIDCDAEELVGVQLIHARKFGKSKRLAVPRTLAALTLFEKILTEDECSVNEAIKIAARIVVHRLTPRVFNDVDQWDYQQLTRCFWSKRAKDS